MPNDGMEIYLTELEVSIMRAFFNTIYLTDSEMAGILGGLADKLSNRDKAINRTGFTR